MVHPLTHLVSALNDETHVLLFECLGSAVREGALFRVHLRRRMESRVTACHLGVHELIKLAKRDACDVTEELREHLVAILR